MQNDMTNVVAIGGAPYIFAVIDRRCPLLPRRAVEAIDRGIPGVASGRIRGGDSWPMVARTAEYRRDMPPSSRIFIAGGGGWWPQFSHRSRSRHFAGEHV